MIDGNSIHFTHPTHGYNPASISNASESKYTLLHMERDYQPTHFKSSRDMLGFFIMAL